MAENPGGLVVETFKLTKIYQNRQIALNDVTLRMEPGCVLGLLGPNGAGKTTFLRTLNGLVPSAAGKIEYEAATSPASRRPISRGSASATCRRAVSCSPA